MSIKTIHIFGYGETQIIGKDSNVKVSSLSLTKLQAVVDNVFSKKPIDNNSSDVYHAINIFKNAHVDYLPKEKGQKSFRIKYSELDSSLVDELITEIQATV
jgi:hypothetical protein